MTISNDNKHIERMRVASTFFDFGFDVDVDYSPKDLCVYEGSLVHVRSLISTYHYSNITPDSTTEVYIGKYEDQLAGVCLFGMGVTMAQYTSILPNIKSNEHRELTRLWSPDNMPKNTESRLISESLKHLSKKGVKLVISYADPSQDHIGYIYQATNWYYVGKSSKSIMLFKGDEPYCHLRNIGILQTQVKQYENMTIPQIISVLGLTKRELPGKHKYVYLLGSKRERRKMLNEIKGKILPYPKLNS